MRFFFFVDKEDVKCDKVMIFIVEFVKEFDERVHNSSHEDRPIHSWFYPVISHQQVIIGRLIVEFSLFLY